MRLTSEQIKAIKDTTYSVLGEGSRVILFGSRVDDAKKAVILICYLKLSIFLITELTP